MFEVICSSFSSSFSVPFRGYSIAEAHAHAAVAPVSGSECPGRLLQQAAGVFRTTGCLAQGASDFFLLPATPTQLPNLNGLMPTLMWWVLRHSALVSIYWATAEWDCLKTWEPQKITWLSSLFHLNHLRFGQTLEYPGGIPHFQTSGRSPRLSAATRRAPATWLTGILLGCANGSSKVWSFLVLKYIKHMCKWY